MKWRLRVLSPLHVGRDRLELTDFTWSGSTVYVLDEQRLAAWLLRLGLVEDFVSWSLDRDTPTVRQYMLEKHLLNAGALLEVSSRSIPFAGNPPRSQLLEHVTDVLTKEPMIPGSSIKGAMRNAIMTGLATGDKLLAETVREAVGDRRARERTVGAFLDNRLMRGSAPGVRVGPNTDWLRCVRVADAHPLRMRTEIAEVKVFCASERGGSYAKSYSTWIEAILPGSVFEVHISFDAVPLKTIRGRPPFSGMDQIEQFLSGQADRLIKEDREFYTNAGLSAPLRFLDSIGGVANVRLGWGSGWLSTSTGSAFDASLRREVGKRFYKHWGNLPFPRHRKLTVDRDGRAQAPLGWVALEPQDAAEAAT